MERQPRRRLSRELPPSLSELMDTLIKYSHELIRLFDSSEDEMRRIVGELNEIAGEVREMHENTDTVRRRGAVAAGVGVVGIIFATLTGGVSLLAAATAATAAATATAAALEAARQAAAAGPATAVAAAAVEAVRQAVAAAAATVEAAKQAAADRPAVAAAGAAAAAALAAGGAAVVGANVRKITVENQSLVRVKKLGKDFLSIAEPMKRNLEEIKTTCEELEEQSSEVQAEETLRNMEEFTDVLTRVSGLRTESEGLVEIIRAALTSVHGLLGLLVSVVRVTATPEQDAEFRASIILSAYQSQRVTEELEKMKDTVKDFKGQ